MVVWTNFKTIISLEELTMENKKLGSLLKDKEFLESIIKMETPEEVQKAFKEKGIDFSKEEILSLGDVINKTIEKGVVLSEEELDRISGGSITFSTSGDISWADDSRVDITTTSLDDEDVTIIRTKKKKPLEPIPAHLSSFVAGFGVAAVTAIAVASVVKWARSKRHK